MEKCKINLYIAQDGTSFDRKITQVQIAVSCVLAICFILAALLYGAQEIVQLTRAFLEPGLPLLHRSSFGLQAVKVFHEVSHLTSALLHTTSHLLCYLLLLAQSSILLQETEYQRLLC